MPVPIPAITELAEKPELVHALPRPACIAMRFKTAVLLAELEARLAELAVPVAPMSLVERDVPISMREAAARVGQPYNTFRQKWRRSPGLRACLFGDGSSKPKFLPSRLDAYIKRDGKPPAARRGIGR